jgi:hypothetical protein
MGEGGESHEGNRNPGRAETMASSAALKLAKKELRSLMKQKLSTVTPESVNAQSKLRSTDLLYCY